MSLLEKKWREEYFLPAKKQCEEETGCHAARQEDCESCGNYKQYLKLDEGSKKININSREYEELMRDARRVI